MESKSGAPSHSAGRAFLVVLSFALLAAGALNLSIFYFGYTQSIIGALSEREDPFKLVRILFPFLLLGGLLVVLPCMGIVRLVRRDTRARQVARIAGVVFAALWLLFSVDFVGIARLIPPALLPESRTATEWFTVDRSVLLREYWWTFRSGSWAICNGHRIPSWDPSSAWARWELGSDYAPAAQYVPGVVFTALFAGFYLFGKQEKRPQKHDELVAVFETKQESEAMVVRGLLESAGIESLIAGLEAPQDVLPGVGGVTLRVAPEQAEEARRLIAEYRAAGPEPLEEDAGSEEEPPVNGPAA